MEKSHFSVNHKMAEGDILDKIIFKKQEKGTKRPCVSQDVTTKYLCALHQSN